MDRNQRYRAETLANGYIRIDDRRSGLVWLYEADGRRRSGNGIIPAHVLASLLAVAS